MYQFQKAIGEEQVNKALRRFLEDWNTTKMIADRLPVSVSLGQSFLLLF